jgi:predicted ABC-type ATPase
VTAKAPTPQACIYVIAGPNGAGKSSIIGAMLLEAGGDYFNPDAESKRIRHENSNISEFDANSMAWKLGKSLLERAIRDQKTVAFETTLGGNTIPSLLGAAVERGIQLKIWFICLSTAELHILRVRSRVGKGGHGIPEAKIRERFERGRANLLDLLPKATELRLYDNTFDADPDKGATPEPLLVLHSREGQIVEMCAPANIPNWAKPIVELAMKMAEKSRR